MKPDQLKELIAAMEAAINWYAAIEDEDGDEGVNYQNGDSDRYPGNAWDHAVPIFKRLSDSYAVLVNAPHGRKGAGKAGGKARAAALSPDRRKEIAKGAASARWSARS